MLIGNMYNYMYTNVIESNTFLLFRGNYNLCFFFLDLLMIYISANNALAKKFPQIANIFFSFQMQEDPFQDRGNR